MRDIATGALAIVTGLALFVAITSGAVVWGVGHSVGTEAGTMTRLATTP